MSNRTPGAWNFYESGIPGEEHITIRSGQRLVAQLGQETRMPMPPEERRANARLIAAAPFLFELLKHIHPADIHGDSKNAKELCDICDAIAKVEGK